MSLACINNNLVLKKMAKSAEFTYKPGLVHFFQSKSYRLEVAICIDSVVDKRGLHHFSFFFDEVHFRLR